MHAVLIRFRELKGHLHISFLTEFNARCESSYPCS